MPEGINKCHNSKKRTETYRKKTITKDRLIICLQ